jgi:hypothetical protein
VVLKSKKKTRRSRDDDADLISIVREDKQYIRSKKQLERIMADIDTKLLMRELFGLHSSRGITALSSKKIVQDAVRVLIDSNVDEISVRSRATTINMSCLQALLEIEEIYSYLSKYLLSQYAGVMKKDGHTTITAQRAQVEVYLRVFLEHKRNLEFTMKMAEMVFKDIDQASFGLRRIQDALETTKKDR